MPIAHLNPPRKIIIRRLKADRLDPLGKCLRQPLSQLTENALSSTRHHHRPLMQQSMPRPPLATTRQFPPVSIHQIVLHRLQKTITSPNRPRRAHQPRLHPKLAQCPRQSRVNHPITRRPLHPRQPLPTRHRQGESPVACMINHPATRPPSHPLPLNAQNLSRLRIRHEIPKTSPPRLPSIDPHHRTLCPLQQPLIHRHIHISIALRIIDP